MSKRVLASAAVCVGFLVLVGCSAGGAQGQGGEEGMLPGEGFAAVPGLKGGQDIFGPYDVVENWPQPMSASLPDHEEWTYASTMDVFAESPDRVLVASRGEIPVLNRSELETVRLPQVGPSLAFPVFRLPLRSTGVPRMLPSEYRNEPGVRVEGVDFRFEHSVFAVDREGMIIEEFEQWEDMWVRPHDIEISPYDPEKHIWIIDAEGHSVRKFTNDMSEMVLELGTPGEGGEDDTHFRRPTFLVFMDANTMYLADGYDNQRIIKYDMDGNILAQWGETGESGGESRPGYMYNVHGIAVDPTTREVFVNDRNNSRVHVFDEDGAYLREWTFGPAAADGYSQLHRDERPEAVGGRSRYAQDPGLRPGGQLPVLLGQLGRVSRRVLWRARARHGPGGQFLHGLCEQRPGPEVRAAGRRQPGVHGGQAVAERLVGPDVRMLAESL